MIGSLQSLFKIPELRKRIFFTLAFLAIFRIGTHIPVPGVNVEALGEFFSANQGSILGFFDMFSGGALRRLTIFALGIMPYISASIILQLLTVVIPYLDKLKKEGELGRRKITQYTRYGTVFLASIQGFGISVGLEQMVGPVSGAAIVPPDVAGWSFRLLTVLTLTAGTAFIMWLGEQITERGIGNGISLIIFAGIVASIPAAVVNTFRQVQVGELQLITTAVVIIMMALVIAAIVYVETAHRRIPIQYAKRVVGRKMYGGQSTYLPLKVNTAGVIPPIFASSIIMFPATIAQFTRYDILRSISDQIRPGTIIYSSIFVMFTFFFCYFYTSIIFNPVDVADNMRKYGGYVPGIRPGRRTADYIDRIMTRLTFVGAIYLSLVAIMPDMLIRFLNVPFYFGGTSLLIVVGVALDTVQQLESHLVMRHYEPFLKKGRLRGRR